LKFLSTKLVEEICAEIYGDKNLAVEVNGARIIVFKIVEIESLFTKKRRRAKLFYAIINFKEKCIYMNLANSLALYPDKSEEVKEIVCEKIQNFPKDNIKINFDLLGDGKRICLQ
jgi:hypothetical protein